ncbi:MAG: DUF302 domain-containing protein [Candidatus Neomarinimicrobiota bacterium]
MNTSYGYQRTVNRAFAETDSALRAALQDQGFGIITEIDVKATMQQKLGVTFPNYRILGACNPPIAFEVLTLEKEIGLLLPCNVVLWENDDQSVTVAAVDAARLLAMAGRDDLNETAELVNNLLKTALDSL